MTRPAWKKKFSDQEQPNRNSFFFNFSWLCLPPWIPPVVVQKRNISCQSTGPSFSYCASVASSGENWRARDSARLGRHRRLTAGDTKIKELNQKSILMVIITLMRATGRRLAPERTLLIYLFDFSFCDGRVKLCCLCSCPAKCLMEKGGNTARWICNLVNSR
jgi:hypothetical protein